MKRTFAGLLAIASVMLCQSCGRESAAPRAAAAPAAKVENRVTEAALTRVKITPEAYRRLGIELAEARESDFGLVTTVDGEVVPVPGKALQVGAPVAGTITLVSPAVRPGQQVRKGDMMLRLTPLAGVQRDLRVSIEADLQAAKARLDNATVQLERARQLLRDLAGSQRNVDTAEQEFAQAKAGHEAARQRLEQINTRPLDADVFMAISAPESGMIRQVQAAEGQAVAAGAPLFEVVDFGRVWLRVPVYSAEAGRFRSLATVTVQQVDGTGPALKATRVSAPPTADPWAVTVDLYFELANPDYRLSPGQRLRVQLPAEPAGRKRLTIPSAAVLYDIHGGTWAYVEEAEYTYRRQRVEVAARQGDSMSLARGLAAGARVVTAGAAELYGTEFGAGK